jgi:hypothetical protein
MKFSNMNLYRDYARTLNKIIFDKARESPEGKELIEIDLDLPVPSDDLEYKSSLAAGTGTFGDREVPYFGMIPIPAHDFPK